ncbi:MAG: retention module-containing protein, partial [Shewanella sp.]|nr:retention module-containing protein [Shewanella sp.]
MNKIITTQNGVITAVKNGINIDINGQSQPVVSGQEILQGTTLLIAENSSFELRLQDGIIQTQQDFSPTESSDDALAEIEALQQLIESGDDPTEGLPETAAGGQTGNQGGTNFTSVNRAGDETLASTVFDTNSLNVIQQPQPTQQQELTAFTDSVTNSQNDTNTVAEDAIATGNLLLNDSDIDTELSIVSYDVNGQTVLAGNTVTLNGGALTINADGNYSFTPNENWNGTVPTITYTTNTGSTATLIIEVTPVDDASVLTNDTNMVAEETVASGNVLTNDDDVDSDLTVTSYQVDGKTITAGEPVTLEGGELVINADGSYSFTPNENWNGTVPTITYTTNTGSTATLIIEVTPVDDAPTINVTANDFVENDAIAGDVAATYNANDEDSDNDDLTVNFAVGSNDDGYYAIVNGEVVLTQAGADWVNTGNALPAIQLTVSDGVLTGEGEDIPVVVEVDDTAPIGVDDSANVNEGGSVDINVAGNDSDSESGLNLNSIVIVSSP